MVFPHAPIAAFEEKIGAVELQWSALGSQGAGGENLGQPGREATRAREGGRREHAVERQGGRRCAPRGESRGPFPFFQRSDAWGRARHRERVYGALSQKSGYCLWVVFSHARLSMKNTGRFSSLHDCFLE